MTKKTGTHRRVLQAAELDMGKADAAFQKSLPDLGRVLRDQLQPVRVDLQVASAIAHSVATRDSAPARRARLAALAPSGIFDIALLDGLDVRALAAWHARRKQREAAEASSDARVPEATLRAAQELRARMLRVLTYYFEDQDLYREKLADIRSGTGYVDLGNDLVALAELYEVPEVTALVSRDPAHYRATDPADARKLTFQIFEGLGIGAQGDVARWTDLAQRAWTLLARDYGVLRAAGQLVFRNEEDVDITYPSLVTAARAPSRASSPSSEPAPDAPSASAVTKTTA